MLYFLPLIHECSLFKSNPFIIFKQNNDKLFVYSWQKKSGTIYGQSYKKILTEFLNDFIN